MDRNDRFEVRVDRGGRIDGDFEGHARRLTCGNERNDAATVDIEPLRHGRLASAESMIQIETVGRDVRPLPREEDQDDQLREEDDSEENAAWPHATAEIRNARSSFLDDERLNSAASLTGVKANAWEPLASPLSIFQCGKRSKPSSRSSKSAR